jgi:uncharacterized damage-inducible protein DinB
MSMSYLHTAIPESDVPRSVMPLLNHALDIYAGETSKVASTWQAFVDGDLDWRPHPRSATVGEILRHQLLSERRFFGEFLQVPEPNPQDVLPPDNAIEAYTERLVNLARPRLVFLAGQNETWWLTRVPFFDVERERIWVFWRRVLHTAHHRTQLTVYLRLLDRSVPATYGPTAGVTWAGADPTQSIEAAGRR